MGAWDKSCAVCARCPAGKVRSGCGGASSGECVPCANDEYESDGKCLACSGCDAGFYRQGCGGAASGKCLPCPGDTFKALAGKSECKAATQCDGVSNYETKARTRSSDRVCSSITECADDEFQTRAPSKINNRECTKLQTCDGIDTYESKPPTKTTDRVCAATKRCSIGGSQIMFVDVMTELADGSSFISRQMEIISKPAEYESLAPTPTSDRECEACEACPGGKYASIACGGSSKGECAACLPGTFKLETSVDDTCSYCKPCEKGYYRQGCGGTSEGTCVQCSVGTYKDRAGTYETECRECEPCGAGLYRSKCGVESEGTCLPCAVGSYKVDYGTSWDATCTACAECPAGEQLVGCGGDRIGECIPCAAGSFKAQPGGDSCTKCATCAPGFELSANGDDSPSFVSCGGSKKGSCRACGPNFYKSTQGAFDTQCIRCSVCPEGSERVGCGASSAGVCETALRACMSRKENVFLANLVQRERRALDVRLAVRERVCRVPQVHSRALSVNGTHHVCQPRLARLELHSK